MQVCELTPYAMQKSILSLPSFKDLKKKKKKSVTSSQDQLYFPQI